MEIQKPKGMDMKARLFRLSLAVGMLAVVVEALAAGSKWG